MKSEDNKVTDIILIVLGVVFTLALTNYFSFRIVLDESRTVPDESQTVYVNSEVKKTDRVDEHKEVPVQVDFNNSEVYEGIPFRWSTDPKDDDIVSSGNYTLSVVATTEPTTTRPKFLMKEINLKISEPVYFKNIYLGEVKNIPLPEMGSAKLSFKILRIEKAS